MKQNIEQLACNMSLQDMQFHYELLRQALRNTISRHLADNGGEIECNILVQETMGLSDAESVHFVRMFEHEDGTIWALLDDRTIIDLDYIPVDEQMNIVEHLIMGYGN